MSFSLTGPISITVNQGESASAIYRAVRLTKPYRNVSFSVTTLPPGITAAFIPVSCTPTCQVILTLTASLSSAPGIYTIQVIARDAKSSKSMSTSVFVVSRGQVNIPEIANWYVATNGSDAASGTDITHPFLTIGKAVSVVSAGQLIYVRGGTYVHTSQITLSSGGASGSVIRLFAYPGETPIIDASVSGGFPDLFHAVFNFTTGGNFWWLKGMEIKNGPWTGVCIRLTANNITLDQLVIHHCVATKASGAGIGVGPDPGDTPSNILIRNCDSHHNSYGVAGTGGDGIQINYTQQNGNVVRGCRTWRNNDDGVDLWDAKTVLVENCWSWENGRDDALNPTTGNGAGFKLGGAGAGDGAHTIRNNLAWRNDEFGFDHNGSDIAMTVYNNTAYDNYGGYGFAFDSLIAHLIRNNIAHSDLVTMGSTTHDHNTWDSAVTLTDADFQTLDFTANTGSRQSDGSLPTSNFLKLAGGSDLIDAGVDVGLPFNGAAPDMGAYET